MPRVFLRTPRARAHRRASNPIFDATRTMSAVTVANLPPAVGRVAVARRAVSSGSSRSSPFIGAKVTSRPTTVPRAVRAAATIARARDPTSDPRDSPIARIAAGVDAPAAAPARAFDVRAAFESAVERLWNARKALACAALAVVLSLADAGAAVAGRSGRSGGRMGGSSFRSTSSRSMGGGHGAAGRGAGAGAAAATATGAGAAAGQHAGYAPAGPRFGLGMPSFFFMPSFGYGYGYGAMGAGFMMMKLAMNLMILFLLYQFIFGGRSGRGGGASA